MNLDFLFLVTISCISHVHCKVLGDARTRREASQSLPKVDTDERLRKLRFQMSSARIKAYIIPSVDQHMSEYVAPHFQRRDYISGFTGSKGDAVVTTNKAGMWTDGRYFLQASMQMDENWTLMKMGVPGTPTQAEWLIKELSSGDKVGVDAHLMSIANYESMSKELKAAGITLEAVPSNLVDKIWTVGRPALSNATIFSLEMKFTGKSWGDKIKELRAEMSSNDATAVIVYKLDEVAWLLNLRGSDVPANPFFFAFVIVTENAVKVFVKDEKLTPEVRSHLTSATILSYNVSQFIDYIKAESNETNAKIWLSPYASYAMKEAVQEVVWEHLYKIESGRDVGTLYYFRNLFGRNNVKQKVKDGFAPAEDLFLQVFNAYVVAAFMDWTGMMEIQSLPTKVSTPPDARRNQQEKIQYLNGVTGSFVDSFCLAVPNVKKAIEKQREQQQQACVQNNNIDSVQSNNISPGSILFLLKGSKESGFTFEGLATCITFCSTTHCIMVRVVKVLSETATLPNSSQPLREGEEVTWPSNLVALYRMTTAPNERSDGNNSKDQDRAADSTKDDHLANYGIWIIQMGMLLLQLNDTEKEGDGEIRTIINSKVLLLVFRSTTRSKKYAFEMLRLISKVKCQFTDKMAERTIHGRFVNWKGGEGNDVANDLEEEHFVQFDKKLLKGMGAQKSFKAVERATRAACGLKKNSRKL